MFFSLQITPPEEIEGLNLMTYLIALYDDEESQRPDIYK